MYKNTSLTVDIIIIHENNVVLIKRANHPYKGNFVLPGGFVEIEETLVNAAIREAKEETSLDIKIIKLIGIYDDPARDPRGRVVSVCYLATCSGTLKANSDAKEVVLMNLINIPRLAFDHSEMIHDAYHEIHMLSTFGES